MTTPLASRGELARGSALSFVGSATSAVMGLVLIIALGRTLGDAGSGIALQTIGVFTIALGVARFGMDSSAIWILPRLLEDDRQNIRLTGVFLLAVAAAAGVICALILLLGTAVADAVSPGDPVAGALRSIVWFLPVASVLLTALSATRALGRVTAYVLVGNVALPALRPLAIVLVVGLGAGVTGVALAWALPLVPAMLAAVLILGVQLRRNGETRRPGYLHTGLPSQTIRYALPRVLSSSLEQLLIWLAVIVVGAIAGPAAAGIYGSASRFVAAGMIVDTALRVVVSPMFSRLQHRGDRRELEDIYALATVWLTLFSTPVYLLLASFAPVALSLLGDDFSTGEPVLIIMCAGAVVTFLAGNIHSVLLMSGRSGLAALNKAIVVSTNITLLYVLVPMWGVIGAATAWAIACALDAALATLEVRMVLRIGVSPAPGLYPLFVGVISVGIPAIAARLILGPTWLGLAAAVIVGGALFFLWCRLDRARLRLSDLSVLPWGR